MSHLVDWAQRWVGGFWAIAALGGPPIRCETFPAQPTLGDLLARPEALGDGAPPASYAAARDAWSAALGGRPIVLVRSVDRARALIMAAAETPLGEPIGVPANANQALVEAVKRRRAHPRFVQLDAELGLDLGPGTPARGWAQPPLGVHAGAPPPGWWIDRSDTLPLIGAPEPPVGPRTTIWGLHLAVDPERAGALIVFGDEPGGPAATGAARLEALCQSADRVEGNRAIARLAQLAGPNGNDGLVARQWAALAETWRGADQAAGLPLLPFSTGALGHGVVALIPEEADPPTFLTYVRAENTPIRWLPELRPLQHVAMHHGAAWQSSARHLDRAMLLPVGPAFGQEEIGHLVLGLVKAAEHLGVRWRTDPERATWYARWLNEAYGPNHDGYRPVFDTTVRSA